MSVSYPQPAALDAVLRQAGDLGRLDWEIMRLRSPARGAVRSTRR